MRVVARSQLQILKDIPAVCLQCAAVPNLEQCRPSCRSELGREGRDFPFPHPTLTEAQTQAQWSLDLFSFNGILTMPLYLWPFSLGQLTGGSLSALACVRSLFVTLLPLPAAG